MKIRQPYDLKKLKSELKNTSKGILFCFGDSFISKIIQLKTRLNSKEVVPSHVALIYDGFIYESTSQDQKIGNKTIPSGVRRWLLKDFYKVERGKETKYIFAPYDLYISVMEKYIHYPYGIDTIVDFVLRDGSDGVSKGLICSQYANKVTELLDMDCPNPAEMYREAINRGII